MADQPCKASIRGVPDKPFITEIWVQARPAASSPILFSVTVGLREVQVLDVAPDAAGNRLQDRVYQWFKLGFPDGRVGWVREDFLNIEGNCSRLGYGVLSEPTYAFSLTRKTAAAAPEAEDVAPIREIKGSPLMAAITGIPSMAVVNIRTGPSTTYQPPAFTVKKGIGGLKVLEVRPDEKGASSGGKVFQWFKLEFPDGRTGWCRDDLISIQGDGRPFGYDLIQAPILAFTLTRVVESGAAAATSARCTGRVVSPVPARVRSGPNVTHSILTQMQPGTEVEIRGVREQDDGGPYRWVRVQFGGHEGWSRSDNFVFTGECGDLSLPVPGDDLYPAPMKAYRWVRGFTGSDGHRGWDLAFDIGTPVYCGPKGGLVVRCHLCTKCTPDKPSTTDHGLPLSDPQVFADAAWGWGFGHHVIVRYLHDQLPASTQRKLAAASLPGWHLYVTYAHLNSIEVDLNQQLTGETVIGTLGNTGNSTGPHLHIEVRAWNDVRMGPWLRTRLLEPDILFRR
ncbi:MAG: hypothetical protein Kow00124_19160 [Anaerolineae bacterium]